MSKQNNLSCKYIVKDADYMPVVLGNSDQNVKIIEEAFKIDIFPVDNVITLKGEDSEIVYDLFEVLEQIITSGHIIQQDDLHLAIRMAKEKKLKTFLNLYVSVIGKTYDGKEIRPKTLGQEKYIEAIKKSAITFGIGPAGTGKTFLAVVFAVQALKKGLVKRIIVTRPAVEAGESLGFLPGDLKEKVDPYLRPIYDALYTVYGVEHTERLLERGIIEIAPLAYMRGRTLDDAFVILDEAQNTTAAQMKMFLTRLGYGSKMIVNGDISQIDLPRGITSGLIDAKGKLAEVSHISLVYLTASDVIRHPVVAAIIEAYDKSEKVSESRRGLHVRS